MIKIFEEISLKGAGISHGFLSRKGGKSKGIYKGLNVGLGSNDDRNLVLANRGIIAEYLNIPVKKLYTLYQVHSSKVITITNKTPFDDKTKADGMVTNVF